MQLPSTTTTAIHNTAHATVTAVAVGTTVHDLVTVNGGAGESSPTGSVSIDWFLNGTCAGAPAVNSGSVGPLAPSGARLDATAFAFTVNTAGQRAFRAHYLGDPATRYTPSDGPCEPLSVVDANIQITPTASTASARRTRSRATSTSTTAAASSTPPAGTTISFSINGGPPSLNCTTRSPPPARAR